LADTGGRMKPAFSTIFAAIVFCLGTALLCPPAAIGDDFGLDDNDQDAARKVVQGNMECLSCHGAATSAAVPAVVIDPARPSGPSAGRTPDADERVARQKALVIDRGQYETSVHADVSCKDCHADPHGGQGVRVSCPQCHRTHDASVVPEVARSVHAAAHLPGFTCFSCHDPHNVRKAASLGTERTIAHRDNSMCLGCHGDDARYARFSAKPRPDLLAVHSWQPNPALHWAAVRCIDCHTPEKPGGAISHEILPKAKAERFCVDCHSTDSSLMTRLYRHEVETQRVNAAGFVHAYILTQAYVVGVTRNRYLDGASMILLAGVVVALAGHGLLRTLARRARKGRK